MTEPTVAPINNPDEVVTAEDLTKWYGLVKELEIAKDLELTLRKKIFAGLFKNPQEGVNKVDLTDGYVLKADHKINRKVHEDLLLSMSRQMRDIGLNPDVLVNWKPELKISEYRKLTESEHAIFDQVLTITPGTPQLEIVLPKRK